MIIKNNIIDALEYRYWTDINDVKSLQTASTISYLLCCCVALRTAAAQTAVLSWCTCTALRLCPEIGGCIYATLLRDCSNNSADEVEVL